MLWLHHDDMTDDLGPLTWDDAYRLMLALTDAVKHGVTHERYRNEFNATWQTLDVQTRKLTKGDE